MRVLLGCFAEQNTVERCSCKGCSLVRTFHLCLLLHSRGDSRSHCSGDLSVFCDRFLSVWGLLWGIEWGDSPALHTGSATAGASCWVSVEGPGIGKITRRNACVFADTSCAFECWKLFCIKRWARVVSVKPLQSFTAGEPPPPDRWGFGPPGGRCGGRGSPARHGPARLARGAKLPRGAANAQLRCERGWRWGES